MTAPMNGEDGGDGASTHHRQEGGDGGPLDAGALVDAGALPSAGRSWPTRRTLRWTSSRLSRGHRARNTLAENPAFARADARAARARRPVARALVRSPTRSGPRRAARRAIPEFLKDAPLGTCGSDIYQGRSSGYQRYSLADPTGTACVAKAVKDVGAFDVDRLVGSATLRRRSRRPFVRASPTRWGGRLSRGLR